VRLTAFAGQGLSKQQQVELERHLSEALQNALSASVQLHKIPKSSVDVFVMVLESGGADLAVAITAASVALADTGIELYDIVPACQVIKRGGVIYLDPTAAEEEGKEASVLMAYMPSLSEVTQLDVQGCWGDSELKETLELCLGACAQLKTSMHDALIHAVENTNPEM
jgi:exosome complex component MTR3